MIDWAEAIVASVCIVVFVVFSSYIVIWCFP